MSGHGLLAWDADGREMRCMWASGYTSGREIWGRGLRDIYTWPTTQIAVGAALDRNCDQVQPAVSAKTERAQRVGQVAGLCARHVVGSCPVRGMRACVDQVARQGDAT